MTTGDSHVPWGELIIPQAINFTLFVGLLIYFIKNPIRQHFSGKTADFEKQKRAAEETREKAEKQNFEVRNSLRVLDETTAKNVEEAQAEALNTKHRIIHEAQESAKKIIQDTEKMVEFEHLRAMAALREEFVLNCSRMAEEQLKQKVDEKAQATLNREFVDKVKTVHG